MPAAKIKSGRRFAVGLLAAAGCFAFAPGAIAQTDNAISQAVVQPLPPRQVTDLNTALRRLASNSSDVGALIDAGNASLAVGDVEAAIGFFGRADELSPGNPRVKVGLAGAFVRRERPIEALRLFEEAEQAGASTEQLAADRGLAYDLVGDNAAAQRFYQQALARGENAETRRRFALSHAIAGNGEAFEKVLYPLLEKRDFAAYRTRAFGMAIMGEDTEAVAIAEAVMPRNLSSRIAPYLRYMPRLTKAQQAAAANLGIFPRAAQIGRDSAQIAAYSSGADVARRAGERLAPQGEPLGPRVAAADTTSPRRRPDRGRSAVQAAPPATEPTPPPTELAQADPVKVDQLSGTQNEAVEVAVADSAPVENTTQEQTANATPASTAQPGFDLANVRTTEVATSARQPVVVSTAPARTDPPAEDSTSVADAFANFSLSPAPTPAASSGAVDMTKIKPPREVEKAEEPKPPEHPRRFWVQVATGKDRSALKFDWRRISRKSGDALKGQSPSVTPWGQSNRLLSGPYGSLKEARNIVNSLKESEIDSFTFTSPEGQEIEDL